MEEDLDYVGVYSDALGIKLSSLEKEGVCRLNGQHINNGAVLEMRDVVVKKLKQPVSTHMAWLFKILEQNDVDVSSIKESTLRGKINLLKNTRQKLKKRHKTKLDAFLSERFAIPIPSNKKQAVKRRYEEVQLSSCRDCEMQFSVNEKLAAEVKLLEALVADLKKQLEMKPKAVKRIVITEVGERLLNMEFTINLGSAKTFNLFQEAKLKSGQNSDEEFIRQLLADRHELYSRPKIPKDRADKDASKETQEIKRKEKSCVFIATDHEYTSKELLKRTDTFDSESNPSCCEEIDENLTEIEPSQKQGNDIILTCDNENQNQESDCARDGDSTREPTLKGTSSHNDNAVSVSKPKLVCVTRAFSDRHSKDKDQKTASNISKIGNSGRIKHHLVILNDQRDKTLVEKNTKKGKKCSFKAEKKRKDRQCSSEASSDGQNLSGTMFGCKECRMYFSKYEKLSCHIESAHSALLKNGSTCQEFVLEESMSLLNKCGSFVQPKVEFGSISKEEIVEAIQNQQKQKKEVQEERKRKLLERKNNLAKDLRCTECDRVFKKVYYLRNHNKLYHSDITNLPKCNICNKAFLCKSRVKRHMLVSHSQNVRTRVKHPKGFLCETCGTTFTQKHTLKLHMNKHSNIKPHVCKHCGKKFTWLNALEYHERTHTGERPYPCLLCPQRFKTPSDLKRHQVVHTKEKPFSCSLCSKKFSQRSTLNAHVRNIHRKKSIEPIKQRVAMVDVISLMPNILPDNIHVTLNNDAVAFVQDNVNPVVTH